MARQSPESEMETQFSFNRLIFNYLPINLDGKRLYELCRPFGPVTEANIVRDPMTGRSHGFGFVKFVRPEDANRAISGLDRLTIDNKILKVSYARERSASTQRTNLLVRNIPSWWTVKHVEHFFAFYGEVVKTNLVKEPKFSPYGSASNGPLAFVLFSLRSDAQKALADSGRAYRSQNGCRIQLFVTEAGKGRNEAVADLSSDSGNGMSVGLLHQTTQTETSEEDSDSIATGEGRSEGSSRH